MSKKGNFHALIKKSALYNLFKEFKINHISKDVTVNVNKNLDSFLRLIAIKLKEDLEVSGKKTLSSIDINNAFFEFFKENYVSYLKDLRKD